LAKLNALLSHAVERSVDGRKHTIGILIEPFKRNACANSFAAAGFVPNDRNVV
jgi:hypothetical protein